MCLFIWSTTWLELAVPDQPSSANPLYKLRTPRHHTAPSNSINIMTNKTDSGWFPFPVVSIEIFLSTINWNAMPLTFHSMNSNHLHRALLWHQFHKYKKRQFDWPVQWWVFHFFICPIILSKIPVPNPPSSATPPDRELQAPLPRTFPLVLI
jgi:hypothetical protein